MDADVVEQGESGVAGEVIVVAGQSQGVRVTRGERYVHRGPAGVGHAGLGQRRGRRVSGVVLQGGGGPVELDRVRAGHVVPERQRAVAGGGGGVGGAGGAIGGRRRPPRAGGGAAGVAGGHDGRGRPARGRAG